MLFSSAVLGSVFGALGVFGMLMAYSESLFEVVDEKSQSCKKVNELKNDRKDLQVNFEEIDKIQDKKAVFEFSFEDPEKGSQTIFFD